MALWKSRVGDIETRLREFYWPIYLRLQRDNIVWEKILPKNKASPEERKLARQIEEDILLPNHAEILTIIRSGMHHVRDDKELERSLLAYVRHADVYRCLRAANIWDKDPIRFGEPYPPDFFQLIDRNVKLLQAEYDRILLEISDG